MIELGAIYPVAVDVFDENSQPANPDTATLTITLPDQTQTSPSVPLPPAVKGQIRYAYTTVQPGRHSWRLVTTNPVTVYRDVFDVNEAAGEAILSLADAKQNLRIDPADTSDDVELLAKLQAITRSVQRVMHRQYVPRQITEWHNRPAHMMPWESPKLRLGAGTSTAPLEGLSPVPILSFDSLITYGPQGQVVTTYDTANNMYFDPDTGLVTVYNGPPLAGRMQAIFHAGYQIIPYHIIEGTKVLLQAVWETRRGPGGLNGVIGPEELADWRHFTALPRKAQDWFGQPYPVVF